MAPPKTPKAKPKKGGLIPGATAAENKRNPPKAPKKNNSMTRSTMPRTKVSTYTSMLNTNPTSGSYEPLNMNEIDFPKIQNGMTGFLPPDDLYERYGMIQ